MDTLRFSPATDLPRKPIVFISSTIHDFQDLRHSLKYWLEELGYDVRLSEDNNFGERSELGIGDACLQVIDQCDFFILLVGTRAGFRLGDSSITREEYRHAYARAKDGHCRLLVLVRDQLWTIREDRRAIEDHLASVDSVEREVNLKEFPSKFANDVGFIFSFLSEIARENETGGASSISSLPRCNWVRTFRTFRDITDYLKAQLGIAGSISQAIVTGNLMNWLENTAKLFITKDDLGNIYPVSSMFHHDSGFDLSQYKTMDNITLTPLQSARIFGALPALFLITPRIRTELLDYAIHSGVYLEYNRWQNVFVTGRLQEELVRLKLRLEMLLDQLPRLHADTESPEMHRLRTTKTDVCVPKFLVISTTPSDLSS
jgi:hypothetical protein